MKKTILYSIALVTLAVYVLAGNGRFMRFFVNDWNNDRRPRLLNWDRYKYGDLYGLSYLPEFKPTAGDVWPEGEIVPPDQQTIDLWVIGDSFLDGRLDPDSGRSVLKKTRTKYFWWDNKDKETKLAEFDKTKRNILLIEIAERFVRDTYTNPETVINVARRYRTSSPEEAPSVAGPVGYALAPPPRKPGMFEKRLVSESFSQNIETVLFGYEFLAPLKELKAEMNYRLFSRVSPAVAVSGDGRNLFFAETVDPAKNTSSFKPLPDDELNVIVQNINFVADTYRAIGFDDVLFSIVPNSVTVVDPGRGSYNGLITRLQGDPRLRVRVVDTYSKMRAIRSPAELYRRSDTHWNPDGFNIWVAAANAAIEGVETSPSGH